MKMGSTDIYQHSEVIPSLSGFDSKTPLLIQCITFPKHDTLPGQKQQQRQQSRCLDYNRQISQ